MDDLGRAFTHYAQCPGCGVNCWLDVMSGAEPNLLRIENMRDGFSDYGPCKNWTEVWKCPACGCEFEEFNGT